MTIGDRILLSLHNEAPFATSVPYLKAEVEYIMGNRIAEVTARRATGMTCDVTGAPLVNAVRLDDGRLVMEKQAILMEVPYTADQETRARFEEEVTRRKECVELDESEVVPWRELMPAEGIVPFSQ